MTSTFEMTDDEKRDPRALVLWLVEATEHTDNMAEFVDVVLPHLWASVGLPGELPAKRGLIDLDAVEQVRQGLRRWPDIDKLAANVTEFAARFYSFERAEDVGKVADAAEAAGFETYPYRRDIVVVSPDEPRRSTMAEDER